MEVLKKKTYVEYGFIANTDINYINYPEAYYTNLIQHPRWGWKQRSAALANLKQSKTDLDWYIQCLEAWLEQAKKEYNEKGSFKHANVNVEEYMNTSTIEELEKITKYMIDDIEEINKNLILISRNVFEIVEVSDWELA